ncbi:MAG: DUF2946 family protein [Paracraurococcus sp.]
MLLLQWGTAMAHCLRTAAALGKTSIEVCTAEGFRTIHLDFEGTAKGNPPAGHVACPFCAGSMAPEPGPRVVEPVRVAYAVPTPRSPAGLPPSPPRAPPQQPRAPPIS